MLTPRELVQGALDSVRYLKAWGVPRSVLEQLVDHVYGDDPADVDELERQLSLPSPPEPPDAPAR